MLRSVVGRRVLKSLVHFVSVRRVLERHPANFRGVLAFEEPREEWQTSLGVFGGLCFGLVSHWMISFRGELSGCEPTKLSGVVIFGLLCENSGSSCVSVVNRTQAICSPPQRHKGDTENFKLRRTKNLTTSDASKTLWGYSKFY